MWYKLNNGDLVCLDNIMYISKDYDVYPLTIKLVNERGHKLFLYFDKEQEMETEFNLIESMVVL